MVADFQGHPLGRQAARRLPTRRVSLPSRAVDRDVAGFTASEADTLGHHLLLLCLGQLGRGPTPLIDRSS